MQRGLQECWSSAQRWHLDLRGNHNFGAEGTESIATKYMPLYLVEFSDYSFFCTNRISGCLAKDIYLSLYRFILNKGKAAALRITLNIDGAPVASRPHTQPSHSQTSLLLTSSPSLGVPVQSPVQPSVCESCKSPSFSCYSLITPTLIYKSSI
jgi:hypothetical protein